MKYVEAMRADIQRRIDAAEGGTPLSVTPEPPPQATDKPALWQTCIDDWKTDPPPLGWLCQGDQDEVLRLMQDRDHFGREKYGMPLTVDNGRDMCNDAMQEALDLVVYSRGMVEESKGAGNTLDTESARAIYFRAKVLLGSIVAHRRMYP